MSASSHDLDPVKKGLLDDLPGVILADSGYVSESERKRLHLLGVGLWAKPRQKQEQQFHPVQASVYRCREVVESVISKLKKRFSLVPTDPPRRMSTALAQIFGSVTAYMFFGNHPKMNYSFNNGGRTAQ